MKYTRLKVGSADVNGFDLFVGCRIYDQYGDVGVVTGIDPISNLVSYKTDLGLFTEKSELLEKI